MIDDDSDDEIEMLCPVCGTAFSSANTTKLNTHINDCLDMQATTTTTMTTMEQVTKPATRPSGKTTSSIPTKKNKPGTAKKPKDVFEMLMKGRQ